jgi:hypothetical protein
MQDKTLVFLSTCKQVKYLYSVFKKLRPGVPLRCMHGGMSQIKRMAVFYSFCEACLVLVALPVHGAEGVQDPVRASQEAEHVEERCFTVHSRINGWSAADRTRRVQ